MSRPHGDSLLTVGHEIRRKFSLVEDGKNLLPTGWRLGENQISCLLVAAHIDFICIETEFRPVFEPPDYGQS